MNDFNTEFYVKKAQNFGATDGFLQQYTTGKVYDPNNPKDSQMKQTVLEWQEGKWTIDVFGAGSLDLVNYAKQVDTFLQSHALPPTDGHILVDPNLTGRVTIIGWVFGNTFYVCESPSTWNALDMAVSMREYDSYRVTP